MHRLTSLEGIDQQSGHKTETISIPRLFRYQIFSKSCSKTFSSTNFFETDPIPSKKVPETEWDRDECPTNTKILTQKIVRQIYEERIQKGILSSGKVVRPGSHETKTKFFWLQDFLSVPKVFSNRFRDFFDTQFVLRPVHRLFCDQMFSKPVLRQFWYQICSIPVPKPSTKLRNRKNPDPYVTLWLNKVTFKDGLFYSLKHGRCNSNDISLIGPLGC